MITPFLVFFNDTFTLEITPQFSFLPPPPPPPPPSLSLPTEYIMSNCGASTVSTSMPAFSMPEIFAHSSRVQNAANGQNVNVPQTPSQHPADMVLSTANGANQRKVPISTPQPSVQNGEKGDAEAALREAVTQHQRQERLASQSIHGRETEGLVSNLSQRHSGDRIGLLRRHEMEVNKVKEYLETQLSQLNLETERLKAEQGQQLRSLQAAKDETVAKAKVAGSDIGRVTVDFEAHLSLLKSKHAEALSQRQAQTMNFMQLQEEELERVRALHLQQLAALDRHCDSEVSEVKQRQLVAEAGFDGVQESLRRSRTDETYRVPPLSQFTTSQAGLSHPSNAHPSSHVSFHVCKIFNQFLLPFCFRRPPQ